MGNAGPRPVPTGTIGHPPFARTVEINYNNPLHGVGLKQVLTEIVEHYGFDILYAYLNINCFNNNPSIESSVKFLKKTDWAREKSKPSTSTSSRACPAPPPSNSNCPGDRIIPEDQKPGQPAELSLEDAERLCEKRIRKAAQHDQDAARRPSTGKRPASRTSAGSSDADPWAKWRKWGRPAGENGENSTVNLKKR